MCLVSLRLYFACCGHVRIYGVCVEWDPGSESVAFRGESRVDVCRDVDFKRMLCGVGVLQLVVVRCPLK